MLPWLLTPIAIASITSVWFSAAVFGGDPLFVLDVEVADLLPMVPVLLASGLLFGLIALLFMLALFKSATIAAKTCWSPLTLSLIAALTCGVVAIFVPEILGSGVSEIKQIFDGGYALWFLVLLCVLKLLATSLCIGFGLFGGVFSPAAMIGAAAGGFIGKFIADRLAKLVPGAGHLVHMPAHIYWRVGRYHDASLANIEAAKVDEEYIAQCNAQGFYPALYYPHNVHFLWAASTMEGRSKLSIDSALKVSKYVRVEQIKQIPFLEFFHTIPLLSYVRFAKWDEILSYEKPIEEFKFSLGIYHYARSIAYASKGDVKKAKFEQEKILPLKDLPEIKVIIKAGQPSDKLLEIANHLAMGQIAMVNSNLDASIMHFKMAVETQDALPYREPEFWYYPTRQSLGHALILSKNFTEAVSVFNQDLKDYPRNGWSYFGLYKAHKALGNTELSNKALEKHNDIWQMSDVKLESSIIY